MSSNEYTPCPICNADCCRRTEAEPCWGRVLNEQDAEGEVHHYCAGHTRGLLYWRPAEEGQR